MDPTRPLRTQSPPDPKRAGRPPWLAIVAGLLLFVGAVGALQLTAAPAAGPSPTSTPARIVGPTPTGIAAASTPRPTATPTATRKAAPTASPTPPPTPRPTAARTAAPTLRPTPVPTPTSADAALAGTWRTTTGSSVASTVSAGVGPFLDQVTARTTAVEGTAVVTAGAAGNTIASSHFTVDNNRLSTSDSVIDDQMRDIMETDRYPRSGFEQTSSVPLPPSAELRPGTQTTLRGTMTLHGVTRSVVVPAQVRLSGDTITVVANVPFLLADYNIRGKGLVSVGDTGTMSFHLVLTR